jgi:ABC-2 type transport system ATP-binding protein
VSAPAILVERLSVAYGLKVAVHDISFAVDRGEIVALLGPNGAGKTSTLEVLEGYRTRSHGHVEVLGVDPAGQPLSLRQRVGVVLQECALPPDLRVREALDAQRALYQHPRSTNDLLAAVELTQEHRSFVRRLSGGQRRRLDLALALVGEPELVFLDEPTTGFDPEARHRCWDVIKQLAERGTTVLLTTHYLEEAEALAPRLLVMRDGQIVADGSVSQLAARCAAPTTITATVTGRPPDPPVGFHQLASTITMGSHDPARDVARLLRWSSRHDLDLHDLEVRPPRLNDIYLELVSR